MFGQTFQHEGTSLTQGRIQASCMGSSEAGPRESLRNRSCWRLFLVGSCLSPLAVSSILLGPPWGGGSKVAGLPYSTGGWVWWWGALRVASWGVEWAAPLPTVKAVGSSRIEYFLTGGSAVQTGPRRRSCPDSAAVGLCISPTLGFTGPWLLCPDGGLQAQETVGPMCRLRGGGACVQTQWAGPMCRLRKSPLNTPVEKSNIIPVRMKGNKGSR